MAKKLELEVERWQVMAALAMLKKIKVPGAFLIGKIETFITTLLEKFPESKFRLTVEATDEDKKEATNGEATKITQG